MKKKLLLSLILLSLFLVTIGSVLFYDEITSLFSKGDNLEVSKTSANTSGTYAEVEVYTPDNDNNQPSYTYTNYEEEESDEKEDNKYEDKDYEQKEEYYDEDNFNPNFRYVDLLELEEKELIDSLELALQYAVNHSYGTNYDFCFFYGATGFTQTARQK